MTQKAMPAGVSASLNEGTCGILHITDLLLLIGKNSLCSGGSEFHLSLSGLLPYVQCLITVKK